MSKQDYKRPLGQDDKPSDNDSSKKRKTELDDDDICDVDGVKYNTTSSDVCIRVLEIIITNKQTINEKLKELEEQISNCVTPQNDLIMRKKELNDQLKNYARREYRIKEKIHAFKAKFFRNPKIQIFYISLKEQENRQKSRKAEEETRKKGVDVKTFLSCSCLDKTKNQETGLYDNCCCSEFCKRCHGVNSAEYIPVNYYYDFENMHEVYLNV